MSDDEESGRVSKGKKDKKDKKEKKSKKEKRDHKDKKSKKEKKDRKDKKSKKEKKEKKSKKEKQAETPVRSRKEKRTERTEREKAEADAGDEHHSDASSGAAASPATRKRRVRRSASRSAGEPSVDPAGDTPLDTAADELDGHADGDGGVADDDDSSSDAESLTAAASAFVSRSSVRAPPLPITSPPPASSRLSRGGTPKPPTAGSTDWLRRTASACEALLPSSVCADRPAVSSPTGGEVAAEAVPTPESMLAGVPSDIAARATSLVQTMCRPTARAADVTGAAIALLSVVVESTRKETAEVPDGLAAAALSSIMSIVKRNPGLTARASEISPVLLREIAASVTGPAPPLTGPWLRAINPLKRLARAITPAIAKFAGGEADGVAEEPARADSPGAVSSDGEGDGAISRPPPPPPQRPMAVSSDDDTPPPPPPADQEGAAAAATSSTGDDAPTDAPAAAGSAAVSGADTAD